MRADSGAVRRWLSVALVAGLVVLAHDFWNWDEPVTMGPFGIPRWIYWFVVLQLGLAAVVAWFWQPTRDEDEHE